jgi:hypothetical protein
MVQTIEMPSVNEKITYFTDIGIVNTDEPLRIEKEKAITNETKTIIVASTTRHTIKKALDIFAGSNTRFIVVGGTKKVFPSDLHEELIKENHRIIFNEDCSFSYPDIAWRILRGFSEGMKVCIEMTLIATDMDYLPVGEEVIAVAGTGRNDFPEGGGADTAIVIAGVKSKEYFVTTLTELERKKKGRRIKEILCKPR